MRISALAQVMLCISTACFVASFIVQGFSAEHPLILTFTRASVVSFGLGMIVAVLSGVAHLLFGTRSTALATARR